MGNELEKENNLNSGFPPLSEHAIVNTSEKHCTSVIFVNILKQKRFCNYMHNRHDIPKYCFSAMLSLQTDGWGEIVF
jgi:hypothetical protein